MEGHPAPAGRLGPVHGGVGVAQQRLGVGGVVGKQADPDAGAGAQLGEPDHERLAQGPSSLAATSSAAAAGSSVTSESDDQELVSALAGQHVAVAQHVAQPGGDPVKSRSPAAWPSCR